MTYAVDDSYLVHVSEIIERRMAAIMKKGLEDDKDGVPNSDDSVTKTRGLSS